ncbi:hypothetical protein PUR71_16730 [Streptomyces sp. SP17BM10]|uniref:hypothetical protein n=1 Tax=Streptomyces sp. SP17BM10 TaxID=3002530 RepID=UPI002E7918F1|nr:hypothetical protein [Streptomyces sp. SP17BM10]MEE1784535.1 hypothetical protein [Streptomyces sp. SP17BM10]
MTAVQPPDPHLPDPHRPGPHPPGPQLPGPQRRPEQRQRPGATEPVSAHWAVLGKHPGRAMGYELLAASLDEDRARRYLWGAQTGTPEVRRPDETGGLPWRVFLSGVEGERTAACALIEQSWDGTSDGTGAPIITSRLLLVEWSQGAARGLTWSALADAAAAVRWPGPEEGPARPLRLDLGTLSVASSSAELAAVIDEVGFEWTACVAALLTAGQRITVTADGRDLPTPEQRVRIVDAVAALLPYGCRHWLSGASWTGDSDHKVQLTFAESARTGRTAVRFGAPTARPADPGAAAYLAELTRLRAKGWTSRELVAHLLAATAPIHWTDGPGMLRVLREVDLVDAVLAAVREGTARIEDVARVFELQGLGRLDADGRRDLCLFLARTARPGGPDRRDEHAVRLLRDHWSPELPEWMAGSVLADPDPDRGFDRAFAWLDLLRELHGPGSGSFGELLAALIDQRRPGPVAGSRQRWIAAVILAAQLTFRDEAAPADGVLIAQPDIGRAWAYATLARGGPGVPVLDRLLRAAGKERLPGPTGWLRFTAYACGALDDRDLRRPGDATDFGTAIPAALWRELLDLAVHHRRPLVVSHLWSSYWEVACGPRGPELAAALAASAVHLEATAGPLQSEYAADLDLLRLRAAQGQDVPMAGLDRLLDREAPAPPGRTHLRGRGAGPVDAYAARLSERLSATGSEPLWQWAVEALLGPRPDSRRWPVTYLLAERSARGQEALIRALDRRLLAGEGAWLELGPPPAVTEALNRLPGMHSLNARNKVRHLLQGPPTPVQLGLALSDVHAGGYPIDPAVEVLPGLLRWRTEDVDLLLHELWYRAHPLAERLYHAILQSRSAGHLRLSLLDLAHKEAQRHEYARELLRYDDYDPADAAGSAAQPPDRRGLFGRRRRK